MRAIRTVLIGIGGAAIWPLYLALLSATARAAPWPRSLAWPVAYMFVFLSIALFLANLTHMATRAGGWAESVARMPVAVTRQLRRAIMGLLVAAVALLLPEQLLSGGLIAPGGRSLTVVTLDRLLALGFELVAWVVAYRLVRGKSELVQWLMERPERLGLIGRHRRASTFLLLLAIGTVIGLHIEGYGFTARRLAAAGGQSVLLLASCWAAYALIIRAIELNSWQWIRRSGLSTSSDQTDSGPNTHDLPTRLRQVARLIVPIVGLLIGAWIWQVDLALFRSIGESHISSVLTVGDVTAAIIAVLVTTFVWTHMSTFFSVAIYPRMPEDPGIRFAVLTLSRYFVLGVGVTAGLSAVHLGIEQIGMVLAALGVGLGFGLQEIVSNFVSGIILLIERPIRVGDIVTVSGMSGKVDRINIRATTIINADNQSIIVPNREFITSNLVNWTHKDRIIRLTINVSVTYGTCPDRVSDLLLTIAREDPDVLRNPVPLATLEAFGDSALSFALRVYVPDPSLGLRVRHRLSTQIQRRFRDAQIEMPLPGRELYLRSIPNELLTVTHLSPVSGRLDPASPTPPLRLLNSSNAEETPSRSIYE
jgi:small-conductance mechanosensitive channel